MRPFIGVLFKVNGMEYYAPLSSPKPKHKLLRNSFDMIKIDEGKLGVINFNNMIPVSKGNYVEFDLDTYTSDKSEQKRKYLLQSQLRWLNKNKRKVLKTAYNLYIQYTNDKLPRNIKERCCDFKLLEEKCSLYAKFNNEKIFC